MLAKSEGTQGSQGKLTNMEQKQMNNIVKIFPLSL